MVTHSSTLAWKIPQTEEPGGGYSPWGIAPTGLQSWTRPSDFTVTFFPPQWPPGGQTRKEQLGFHSEPQLDQGRGAERATWE